MENSSKIFFLQSDFYSNNKKILEEIIERIVPENFDISKVNTYFNNIIQEYTDISEYEINVKYENFVENYSSEITSILGSKYREVQYFLKIMYDIKVSALYNNHIIKDKKSFHDFIISMFTGKFKIPVV